MTERWPRFDGPYTLMRLRVGHNVYLEIAEEQSGKMETERLPNGDMRVTFTKQVDKRVVTA